MKRNYIKPVTERVNCRITPLLDGSTSTEWNMGEIGDPSVDPIGEGEDDPNADAKSWAFDLWE